jgi:hypothetical protein
MIVSFVYSHDVISRLSLGSVRDIKNAAMWLCEANERTDGEEGYASVTQRARAWTDGRGSNEDPDWVSMSRCPSFHGGPIIPLPIVHCSEEDARGEHALVKHVSSRTGSVGPARQRSTSVTPETNDGDSWQRNKGQVAVV